MAITTSGAVEVITLPSGVSYDIRDANAIHNASEIDLQKQVVVSSSEPSDENCVIWVKNA